MTVEKHENFRLHPQFSKHAPQQHRNQLFLQPPRAGFEASMKVSQPVAMNFHLLLWKAHGFGWLHVRFSRPPSRLPTHANHPKNGEIERKSPPEVVFERIFRPRSRSISVLSLRKKHVLRRVLFKDITCALGKSSLIKFHPDRRKIARVSATSRD